MLRPQDNQGSKRKAGNASERLDLGPASQAMLERAGIHSRRDLEKLGSVEAYRRAKSANPKASLNLLWAIEGLLSARSWQVVAKEDRLRLLMELEGTHAD